jgi:glycosyltransferase involved in cell wall biosynthesis
VVVTAPPRVSVVMAVYNDAAFVGDAVRSILGQTFTGFELLVIDDGSTDDSASIVRSFTDTRIRLLVQPNAGLAAALNRGIAEAQGEYIARHDSDDLSEPDRLRRQVELLDTRPDVALAGTNATVLEETGERVTATTLPVDDAPIRLSLRTGANPFVHGSVMFRRQVAVEAGLYRPAFRQAQDRDLWLRIAERGKLANLPDALYCWRLRRGGVGASKYEDQRDYSRLARLCAEQRSRGLPEPPLVLSSVQRRWTRLLFSRLRSTSGQGFYDMSLAKMYLTNGDHPRARAKALAVIRRNPLNLYAWTLATLALLPRSTAQRAWSRMRRVYRQLIWR